MWRASWCILIIKPTRCTNYIWVPFVNPVAIKILSLGAIWSFSKGTDYGAKRARLSIMHRDHKGSNPMLINQSDTLISQLYFWNKILHVSDSSSVYRQEFFTVQTTMVYVIQVCWQLAIAVCTVKNSCRSTEELSETCRILYQNRVEKLVHLVGFIVRIRRRDEAVHIMMFTYVLRVMLRCVFISPAWIWSYRPVWCRWRPEIRHLVFYL